MALSEDERDTLERLRRRLEDERPELERLDAYYEGTRRLEQLGLAVPEELRRFVVVVAWPRITADSVEQRCDVEGFRLPDSDTTDPELWRFWQMNNLDEESQQGHLEALALRRSYICVGRRTEDDADEAVEIDSDVPLITVESPLEMVHEEDPRTRRVTAALRLIESAAVARSARSNPLYLPDGTVWSGTEGRVMATLYLSYATVWCERDEDGRWQEVTRDPHNIGRPLVEVLLNRPRLRRRGGISEMADVIDLTDAACRALTDTQVATEVAAIPQRNVAGVSKGDFVDPQTGKPLPVWETYFGAVWATANKDAKFGQFSAADLKNFETAVNLYAGQASIAAGLPARYFGQVTTNPPSEGSIVADESRLIMNAYRKHRGFGGTWERVMRLVRRVVDGEWNPNLARMETLWRNPETPTQAQTADATVKLVTAQVPANGLLPIEAAWEQLGFSATRRAELKRMRDEQMASQAAADPIAAAAEMFRTPPALPTGPAPAESAMPAAATLA